MQALLAKPGGGRQWLLSLRDVPYREASEALCELPGIGPKASLPAFDLPVIQTFCNSRHQGLACVTDLKFVIE